MNETPHEHQDRQPVGTLVDFVTGVDKDNPLGLEIAVDDNARIVVFHDKPFKGELSWFEYNLKESKLDFVMDDGDIGNIGLPLAPRIAKYMHNAHQILTVLMDDKTGDATEGKYIPLIIHQD